MNKPVFRSKALCMALFSLTFLLLNSARLNAQVVDCEVISSLSEIDTNLVILASIPQKLNAGGKTCIPFEVFTFDHILGVDLELSYNYSVYSNEFASAEAQLILQSSGISISDTECSTDNQYNASFSIPNDSLNYDIYINDQLEGNYFVDSMSITLDSISGSGLSTDVFKFCQNGSDSCCIELIVHNPCICGFADITADVTNCNEVDSTFFVTLAFEPQNNGSQFVIGGNGLTYGTYNYSDIPVTLGPLAADGTDYEFIFFDSDDALCFEFIELGEIDCGLINACVLSDVLVEAGACNSEGDFFVDIRFDVINQGSQGFTIQGNGMNYGNFSYGENSYSIGPLLGDCETLYEFVIIDIEEQDCESDAGVLPDVICCPIPDCVINEFSFGTLCIPETLYTLDFIVEYPSSDSFNLFIDNVLIETYSYSALPISSLFGLPVEGVDAINIEVRDLENQDCRFILDNAVVGCPISCEISDLVVETLPCDGSSFYIDFEFETNADSLSTGFEFYVNDSLYQSYSYGETSYTAGPFDGDCSTLYSYTVLDQEDPECSSAYMFMEPVCCDTIVDCIISDISIDLLECDEEVLSFILDFEHVGTLNTLFDVTSRDGYFDTYLYTDLPITITGYPNTGNVEEYIEICDNDNPIECCASWEWNIEECIGDTMACVLTELSVELIECDSISMDISINFDFEGNTNESFDVFSRDGFFNSYPFADLPITIIGFPNTGNDFEFIQICENDNGDCCIEQEWNVEECNESLSLTDIRLESLDYSIQNGVMIFSEAFEHIALYNYLGRRVGSAKGNMIPVNGYVPGVYIVTVAHGGYLNSIKVYVP